MEPIKTLNDYIEAYNDSIYHTIRSHGVPAHFIDHEEMENWVLNNEGLYNHAIECGVTDI